MSLLISKYFTKIGYIFISLWFDASDSTDIYIGYGFAYNNRHSFIIFNCTKEYKRRPRSIFGV